MGKGSDPNCMMTSSAAGTLTLASAQAVQVAERLIAQNPRLPEHRAARLAHDLDVAMSRPVLDNRHIVFLKIGGSFAYGLAHDDSDLDVRGAYLASTDEMFGLRAPAPQLEDKEHDLVVFELGKFLHLAAQKANPTIIETLYSQPLVTGPLGDVVLSARDALLSQRVRSSYGGFAVSQLHKLKKIEPERRAKPTRHMFRVMEQGLHLVRTGEVKVVVDDVDRFMAYGDEPIEALEAQCRRFRDQIETVSSPLAADYDFDTVNDLLISVRRRETAGQPS